MILVTKTFTRPNTDVKFHYEVLNNEEFKNHMKSKYYETGKVVSENKKLDETNLSFTYSGVWKTRADFDEHDTDPVLQKYWDSRDAYNNQNNIVASERTFSEVDL
jgi:hypothetical protein